MTHMSWPLVVLFALSPSILVCVFAWLGIQRDKRRERRAAMQRHPSAVGRRLQALCVVDEAERIVRSAR